MYIGDWLARREQLTPHKVALIDATRAGRPLSYRDWNRAANRTARLLREQFGVVKGDRVAVLAMNCIEYLDIWSACGKLGGSIVFNLLPAAGGSIRSATLVAPGSPYGYGGTKDLDGTPCFDDFAGTGGGVVNPEFAQRIAAGDRSEESPTASPRVVMNTFYWKPPFRPAREEDLLSSLLSIRIGPEHYPGDLVASPNRPGSLGPKQRALAQICWGQRRALPCRRLQAADPVGARGRRPDRLG